MNLPSQHLSDEAIVAFADGALRPGPRDRAKRHLDECPACARAVRVQREAMYALRDAPLPQLPTGLMDRLRAVPTTTVLPDLPLGLDPNGAPVFAAYTAPGASPTSTASRRAPAASPTAPATPAARRHPPFGVFTAAAMFVAVGAGMAGLAVSHATAVPVAPARMVPASVTPAVISGTPVHVDPTAAVWSVR